MEEENLSVLLQGIMTMTNAFYVKKISPKRCTQFPHLSAVLALITWPMRFSYSHGSTSYLLKKWQGRRCMDAELLMHAG